MSTPSALNSLRAPGRLCINPTDLGTAFPHGGTALGLTRSNRFFPNVRYQEVRGEEYGGTVIEKIYAGERPRFACFLREWDANAVSTIFPNSSASVVTADVTTDGQRAGAVLSGNATKLYFSPLAPLVAPALLMYVAVAAVDESFEFQYAPKEEVGLAVVWDALPSSTGKLYQIGLAASLTL